MIHSLVYVSTAKVPFTNLELVRLADAAYFKNQRLGVTGYLCSRRGRFMQYIEGPREPVDALMNAIKTDPRHDVEDVLVFDPIAERTFPGWSLRKLDNAQIVKIEDLLDSLVAQMTASTRSQPDIRKLTLLMARQMIEALAEQHQALETPS